MIVVRVELWPFGDEEEKETLGVAYIANDGSGDFETGNYDFALGKFGEEDPRRIFRVKSASWKRGRVEGFPRIKRGPWDLLYLALRGICEKRNAFVAESR